MPWCIRYRKSSGSRCQRSIARAIADSRAQCATSRMTYPVLRSGGSRPKSRPPTVSPTPPSAGTIGTRTSARSAAPARLTHTCWVWTSRCDPRRAKSTDPETRVVCFGETAPGPRSCFSLKYCWRGPPALKCLWSIEHAMHSRPSTEGRTGPTFGAEHSRGREPRPATGKRPASWSLSASGCVTHRER